MTVRVVEEYPYNDTGLPTAYRGGYEKWLHANKYSLPVAFLMSVSFVGPVIIKISFLMTTCCPIRSEDFRMHNYDRILN